MGTGGGGAERRPLNSPLLFLFFKKYLFIYSFGCAGFYSYA